jgi:hypothetical protein
VTGQRILVALAAAVLAVAVTGPAANADTALASYRVVAQAAGFNWTYDSPTSSFHPQADNELPYAEADGDPTRAHAISSLYWPGAAGGNLGSLISLLTPPGVPPLPNSVLAALNDPVRAEASTTSTNQQATTTPTGTAMAASVIPEPDATQEASSTASWAGAPLAPGTSIGAISAVANQTLGKDGKLVASATNSVKDVDIGGMIHAGLITTSAAEQSVNGGTPTLTSKITVGDLTIGGQKAYVDGSGVHMGEPGKPAGSAVVDSVSKGLAGAGMQIYFTEAAKVTIGGVDYDYAPALLVYWAPTGDTNHDVFTLGFGGAAIQMVISGGEAASSTGSSGPIDLGGGTVGSGTDTGSGTSGLSAVPPSPGSTSLQLPAPTSSAGRALPRVLGNNAQRLNNGTLAAARSPGGIGGWWFLLLGLAALAGAILAPRVPALLNAKAAPSCANERVTPNRRI